LAVGGRKPSGHPIPLGGIVARRSLGAEKIAAIDRMIKDSITWAYANRQQAWGYIKQNAQEMAGVCDKRSY